MTGAKVITISGRPRATKNSRKIIRRGGLTRSVMSDAAAAWIEGARLQVRNQWPGRPVTYPVHIHIHMVLNNRKSLPDGDNIVNGVFDALKKIVVVDDSLACIPSHSFSYELTPGAAEGLRVSVEGREP